MFIKNITHNVVCIYRILENIKKESKLNTVNNVYSGLAYALSLVLCIINV